MFFVNLFWCPGRDSNPHSFEQVPKTCVSTNFTTGAISGAGTRTRTADLLITNQLLYQLSYASNELFTYSMERVTRIELVSSAWKAAIIPLYYTRLWRRVWESNPLYVLHVVRISNPLHYRPAHPPTYGMKVQFFGLHTKILLYYDCIPF